LLEIEKTVVEGAGAAAYAAVARNPKIFKGRKVGIVLSGGNIDMRLLSNVILRELAREGRILSVVVEIEDRPGLLAKIATLVGQAGGNILEVSHNRMMTDMPAKSADLGMVIEARDAVHAEEIRVSLEKSGFTIRKTNPTVVLPPIQTYRAHFSDRMMDDTVRATPFALPIRSSTVSMRAAVSASTTAIMSCAPDTAASERTSGILFNSAVTRSA